jgi:F0F1-type ATP synthase membrane subunit c/vacuolar-type H+-ATPase subunit K
MAVRSDIIGQEASFGDYLVLSIIVSCFLYAGIYAVAILRAAARDPRNPGKLRTRHYAYLIIWERLRRWDFPTLIFVFCYALAPSIVFGLPQKLLHLLEN